MTFLREIQDAAASSTVSVSDLLRKCKILAARLGSDSLAEWVRKELDGYGDAELPPYRFLSHVESKGTFSGPMGSMIRNAPIPVEILGEAIAKTIRECRLPEGVTVYEDLTRSENGNFQLPWPSSVTALFARDIYDNLVCLQAWRVIPRGAMIQIIDSVRTKVLEFALEIERQNPDAGDAPVNSAPIPHSIVERAVNYNFHGSVGNVAAGSHDFEQHAAINQIQQLNFDIAEVRRELPVLREALLAAATEPDHYRDVAAIRSAEIEAEKQDKPKLLGYLSKVGSWGCDIATKIGTTVVADLLKQAIGHPPG
jgi:hypothetical protein